MARRWLSVGARLYDELSFPCTAGVNVRVGNDFDADFIETLRMIRCSNQWHHDPPKPFQVTVAGCLPTVLAVLARMGLPSRSVKCGTSAKTQERGEQCSDYGYFEFSNGHFSWSVNAKWVPAKIVLKKGLNRKERK